MGSAIVSHYFSRGSGVVHCPFLPSEVKIVNLVVQRKLSPLVLNGRTRGLSLFFKIYEGGLE